MTKTGIMFSSILLLLGTLFLFPGIGPAHGQTIGTVCIIRSGATSCPSSPSTITGTVGSQLRVSVFIQNSAPLNGFDITVDATHLILQPSGVDLTGTVLSPPTVISECIGGVQAISGGPRCPSTATADTIELAALCIGCPLTPNPTTGLLFTAIYNVVAATASTPIGYQTGCSSSSVSGTTICVLIANGGLGPVPENVQTAIFNTPDFAMAANPTALSILRGSQATSTITLTSVGGFTGTVTLSTSISPAAPHPPSTALDRSSVKLASGGAASAILTVVTTKNTLFGTYTVTITGTSGTITNAVTVTVTVTH